MLASHRLLGENELASRLPSALSALGLLGLIWWFARRWAGTPRAWLAVLALATCPGFVLWGRRGVPDMCFCLWTSGCTCLLAEGVRSGRTRWLVAGYACGGLALLTKGPLGLVLPGLALGAWLAWERRGPRALRPWWAAVALAVGLPWYLLEAQRVPEFLPHFLGRCHLQRYLEGLHREVRPWWSVPLSLVGLGFPWSLFLAARRPRDELDRLATLSLIHI